MSGPRVHPGAAMAGGPWHLARTRRSAPPRGPGLVPDRRRVHGLPQRPHHPRRGRRLDRRELARVDDGALLAGPVLARRRSPRSDRSSGACCSDRGRVLHLPHADDHLPRSGRKATRQDVRAPSDRPPSYGPTGSRRRLVHGVPSDHQRAAGIARELHRRLRPQRRGSGEAAADVRPLPGERWPDARDAVGDRADPHRIGPRAPLGAVRHVPYALYHSTRWRGARGGQASRTGTVPRVAAQLVQHKTELPGLPHAARRRADADCLGPRRAARGFQPTHVPRR
jgi:hypothetical protein